VKKYGVLNSTFGATKTSSFHSIVASVSSMVNVRLLSWSSKRAFKSYLSVVPSFTFGDTKSYFGVGA
jgi:hypothetical protein|tara:strand:+ start:1058 stop:1258 length:201 start_codon:yes stop_codon:yes gene_type:complete